MLHDHYRKLGSSDTHLSPLGLGTIKLGRDQGVKYPASFRIPNDQEAANLISLAYDLGINLIDTAPAYGNSEERLGKLLKQQRKNWFICSKAGEHFIDGVSSFDFTPEGITLSVENSLQKLKTDFIDAVLIHSDGRDEDVIKMGTLECLADLKKQGKICFTGMSTKTCAGGILALQKSDIAMVTFNLEEQEEKAVIDYAQENNKGIFIKKAFASGHAASTEESLELVLQTAGVTSAIVGTINPQHLKENVAVAQGLLQQSKE